MKMRRKAIYVLFVIVFALSSLSITAFADAIWYSFPGTGASFNLPNTWICTAEGEDYFDFVHSQAPREEELISVDYRYSDCYSIEEYFDYGLKAFLDEYYSTDILADNISAANGNAYTTITVNSSSSNFEWHSNRNWYKYAIDYTAYTDGYLPTTWHEIIYTTIVNGMEICVRYLRDDDINHFSDVIYMLDTMYFEDLSAQSEIKIYVNGNRIESDVPPVLVADRTLVPVRAIAEALDYQVYWDEEMQSVTISKYDQMVELFIGSRMVKTNYGTMEIDVSAQLSNDRTYVPLRAVAELLGASVYWNESGNSVEIWDSSVG